MQSAAIIEAPARARRLRVWIDLENSPHVRFFEPVIEELQRRGHHVVVTGRRFCNTLPLARARGLPVRAIGRGHDTGRNNSIKRCLHYIRSLQLWRFARDQRFDVAANHVSRTQATAAARLGIPVWAATDYEHVFLWDLRAARCFMTPGVMPVGAFDRAGIPRGVIRRYDGLKEDVYLHGFRPAADVRRMLRIGEEEVLVVFRPSSDSAHYDTDAGRVVEGHVLRRLRSQRRVRIVVLPRTAHQRRRWHALENGDGTLQVHGGPLDGPSLICASDLVVTGGGTMAREAAVLGVPAISCFTGPLGAVDEFLAREARVRLIRTVEEAEQIGPVHRHRTAAARSNATPLRQVVDAICDTA
jgi:predicted glycosyltransferase